MYIKNNFVAEYINKVSERVLNTLDSLNEDTRKQITEIYLSELLIHTSAIRPGLK